MSKQDLSQKILEKIQEKKISPKPRWQFLLKNCCIWFFSIICLIIGSLAFAVIIFLVKNNDWDVYEHINDSLGQFILLTLPYFWILFLGLFILITDYNIKHTKKGYAYNGYALVLVTVIISVIFGLFLHNFGVGQAIDRTLTTRMPLYGQLTKERGSRWINIEKGFLAGKIINIETEDKFRLKDLKGGIWLVLRSDETLIGKAKIEKNEWIRMFGKNQGDNIFKAFKIFPGGKRFSENRELKRGSNMLFEINR